MATVIMILMHNAASNNSISVGRKRTERSWLRQLDFTPRQHLVFILHGSSSLKTTNSFFISLDKGSNLAAYAEETLDPSLCWKDIAWLKSITKLPILIKGVLNGEDAMKAIEAGVVGIIVSNHGARQLDYSPATISVLEEVVQAVQGKVPVLLDGGIRRGTDIFKALALGAKAVMIGRPVIYGLAAKGESGVKQVIEMLKNELELTMALTGCCTVDDITRSHVKTEKERFLCKMQALPNMYYDFFAGGAEDQYTLEENTEAFRRIIIWPRILVDVSRIDMSTVILGHKTSAPIMIAPTMMHKFAHPEGEIATARGAASRDVIAGLSFTCKVVRFIQTFALKREITEHMVRQAESNGFRAIILTTDTPALGRRKADITNKMIAPQLSNFEGLLSTNFVSEKACAAETLDRSFFWKEIAWLKSVTKLPILIKGILTSEDAMKAIEAGVAGIIVSNHGARQLDYTPATISVLEEVVHVVQGKVPVLIEGGIRRGTDIFKALALGAKAVLQHLSKFNYHEEEREEWRSAS
ncbi:hypothetical protein H5410_019162 [Solanum commersonii]|uniref:(S)-2-hydroxy-acid oxidase n=1 Tax=Solanum commersonii TaxID=4109 RepID=A0A9J6A4R6_SOLCO|nr:hypothetical protein H5410_019162 [Solanum commersonii]